MKTKITNLLAVLVVGILFTSCEKDSLLSDPYSEGNLKALEVNSTVDAIPAGACGFEVFDLVAGQDMVSGEVTIANTATDLYVKIVTFDDLLILDAHVYAGDIALLPVNKKGNPTIGKFPYKFESETGVGTVIFKIPLTQDMIDMGNTNIFVHAALSNDETAWGYTEKEKENDVIIAIKSRITTTEGNREYCVSEGLAENLIAPFCYWASRFAYTELDLSTFTEGSINLLSMIDNEALGKANLSYSGVNEQLSVEIVPVQSPPEQSIYPGGVWKTYIYVGTVDDLFDTYVIEEDCQFYEAFPYTELAYNTVHEFTIDINSSISGSSGEGKVFETATRWTYYISGYEFCP
jgi:hypothetical protein